MTEVDICRLCLNECKDFKKLYNKDGQTSELHQMLYKYFHPETVNMDEAKHLSSVCLQCFEFIKDFKSFQEKISLAQIKLLDTKSFNNEIQDNKIDDKNTIKIKKETKELLHAKEESSITCVWLHGYNTKELIPKNETCAISPVKVKEVKSPTSESTIQRSMKKQSPSDKNKIICKTLRCEHCNESFGHKEQLLQHSCHIHLSSKKSPSRSSPKSTIKSSDQNQSKHIVKIESNCKLGETNSPRINKRSGKGRLSTNSSYVYTFTKNIYKVNKTKEVGEEDQDKEITAPLRTNDRGLYCCNLCSKIFTNYSKYNNHVLLKHNTKHICSICSLTFKQRTQYRHHILQHKNEGMSTGPNEGIATRHCEENNTESMDATVELDECSDEEEYILRYDTDDSTREE
ncbi:uncharacterized protein [Musca autumnalis]|uniref:uncharacterized protein n=1 Tax=Musca autumnalis TaxID=221902 RepID=UPI003CF3865C